MSSSGSCGRLSTSSRMFFFSADVRAGASSLERRHVDEAQKGGGMQVVESRVHHFEPKKR